ncbi:hypothetical protein AKO1_004363, partial [Acrasis kona]
MKYMVIVIEKDKNLKQLWESIPLEAEVRDPDFDPLDQKQLMSLSRSIRKTIDVVESSSNGETPSNEGTDETSSKAPSQAPSEGQMPSEKKNTSPDSPQDSLNGPSNATKGPSIENPKTPTNKSTRSQKATKAKDIDETDTGHDSEEKDDIEGAKESLDEKLNGTENKAARKRIKLDEGPLIESIKKLTLEKSVQKEIKTFPSVQSLNRFLDHLWLDDNIIDYLMTLLSKRYKDVYIHPISGLCKTYDKRKAELLNKRTAPQFTTKYFFVYQYQKHFHIAFVKLNKADNRCEIELHLMDSLNRSNIKCVSVDGDTTILECIEAFFKTLDLTKDCGINVNSDVRYILVKPQQDDSCGFYTFSYIDNICSHNGVGDIKSVDEPHMLRTRLSLLNDILKEFTALSSKTYVKKRRTKTNKTTAF